MTKKSRLRPTQFLAPFFLSTTKVYALLSILRHKKDEKVLTDADKKHSRKNSENNRLPENQKTTHSEN